MITLTYGDGGLAINLEQAPQVMPVTLQKWMTRVLTRLHQAAAQNMAGGLIGRRSGNLLRALTETVTVTPDGIVGELCPDPTKAIYGGIQEEGGTISPKRGVALAIPLEAMQTGSGIARATAGQVKANPEAYGFKSTFIPKGHSVIMGIPDGGKGARAIPLFALAPSVTIPGKHYLAITLTQNWAWIADLLESMTQDTVNVLFATTEGA